MEANEADELKNQDIFKQTDHGVEYTIVEQRLLQVMFKHKQIFIDGNATVVCGITEFPQKLFDEEYKLMDLLNDFDKYLSKHKDDNAYLEQFYIKLTSGVEDNVCNVAKCSSIARNTRSRRSSKSSHRYSNINNEEMVCHKLLDNIHMHMFHTFDMGYKLLKKEKQYLVSNEQKDDEQINTESIHSKLFKLVKDKSTTYHKLRGDENAISTDEQYNRFSTTVASFTFRDCMINHLLSIISNSEKTFKFLKVQQDRENINALHTWITEQEFDTDAIQDDIGAEILNIQSKLDDVLHYKELSQYFNVHNSCPPLYSFGVRYYYWQCFENNDNESGLEISTDLYDRGNAGYKYSDWFITPKHDNLKAEIIDNKLEALTLDLYNRALRLATIKIGQKFCKKRRANAYWKKMYGIKPRSRMTLQHVLVLVMYCDYDDLCTTFSSTYRKLGYHETDESMKERHREYYHFSKHLREAVEVFGSEFSNIETTIFYHGVNRVMYFANCYAKICGPTSTSYSKEIAINFAENDGIILRLRNEGDITFCMDCTKFSCHGNEEEVLFIGGFASIPFDSITLVGIKSTYKDAVQIINILGTMMIGDRTRFCLGKAKIASLEKVIKCQIGIHSWAFLDMYQENLYKHFFQNVEFVNFDMKLMKQHLVKKKGGINWYGYESLYTLFFDKNLNITRLYELFKMCKNIKTIVIEKWKMIIDEQNIQLCKTFCEKFINYIFTAILSSSYKFQSLKIAFTTPFTEFNDNCPAGHPLKQFDTERGSSCDKCGEKFGKGIQLFVCFENKCNYALCRSCQKSRNVIAQIMKEAINRNQNVFKQHSWQIKLIKHENRAKRIADAVCFSKL